VLTCVATRLPVGGEGGSRDSPSAPTREGVVGASFNAGPLILVIGRVRHDLALCSRSTCTERFNLSNSLALSPDCILALEGQFERCGRIALLLLQLPNSLSGLAYALCCNLKVFFIRRLEERAGTPAEPRRSTSGWGGGAGARLRLRSSIARRSASFSLAPARPLGSGCP
jgi:hypothetical protein